MFSRLSAFIGLVQTCATNNPTITLAMAREQVLATMREADLLRLREAAYELANAITTHLVTRPD